MRGRARASRPARQHLPSDDLVILCRRGNAEAALHHLREIMGKLKLTVNEDKTRICKIPEGEFDFLGYTFGRMYSPRTGQARLGQRPSKKSIKRTVEKVHELTVRAHTWQQTTELVGKLNRALRGWANYFYSSTPTEKTAETENGLERIEISAHGAPHSAHIVSPSCSGRLLALPEYWPLARGRARLRIACRTVSVTSDVMRRVGSAWVSA